MKIEAEIVVWAADIGSIGRNRFGWCRADQNHQTSVITGENRDVYAFVSGIAADISAGYSVALGFECPLFVPVASEPNQLNNGRKGEGNRPWSAGGGSGALATGLPICVWVFEQIQKSVSTAIKPTFDWDELLAGRANLFIWEAFVTATAKTPTHHGDAEAATRSFWRAYPLISQANSVVADNPYSLVGAALLRAGLTTDLSFLSQPCVVIRS